VPVLSLLRPTVSAAGLILPADLMLATGLILATLSVVWVHRVIEIANDVVDALCGSAVTSTTVPAAQSSLARIESLATY
jgi:hypothetical protein